MLPLYEQIDRCHDALRVVAHRLPTDLERDVHEYIHTVRDCTLAMEVLVDQLEELRIQVTLDEFDLIRIALEAVGLGNDRRVTWLAEHGLKPVELPAEDEDAGWGA